MIRRFLVAAPLALAFACAPSFAADNTPPPAYADYVAAVRKADAITDQLQRCLAYPDLPGNTWAPGLAKARCVMFNTPPMFTLATLEQALAQPDGAKQVDAKFSALLDAHFSVPEQREQIFIALGEFKDEDHDKAERIARAWLAASPDSPFAQTALGHVLAERGWDARGTDLMRNTPVENVRRMNAHFADAAEQYSAALKRNPKLLPACVALMALGRQSSDPVQKWAMQLCLDADPASFYVVDEMMTGAEPRWGGSTETMRAVAAYAKARVQANPVLAVFEFNHAYYDIERLDEADSDAQALSILEPASRAVPNAGYLRSVGGAWLRKPDYWKAFVYLSQALRFSPSYAQESRWRAYALSELGELQWARADAERAVALDPKSGHAQRMLADILRDTGAPEAARQHYARAMETPELRENAYLEYCWVAIAAKHSADAIACTDGLVQEYPGNGEAWRLRMMALGPDSPDALETAKRFLATHDPKRWPDHARVAAEVKKMIAATGQAHEGAPEAFRDRAARAQILERSPEGRGFLKQYTDATRVPFAQVMNVCKINGTHFTVVMDIRADGSIANADVAPASAASTCFAKRVGETVKGPKPPAKFQATGFPMVVEFLWK